MPCSTGWCTPSSGRPSAGRCEYTVSGASALNPKLAHFFRGIGVPVLEGYGLTETTAPAAVNTARANRVGTVGLPMPGTTIRIAEDGESPGQGHRRLPRIPRQRGCQRRSLPGRLLLHRGRRHTGRRTATSPSPGGRRICWSRQAARTWHPARWRTRCAGTGWSPRRWWSAKAGPSSARWSRWMKRDSPAGSPRPAAARWTLPPRRKIRRCGPSCSKRWTMPTGWSRGRSRSGSSTCCGRT